MSNITTEQAQQLRQLQALLKQKGYTGETYKKLWDYGSKHILDPSLNLQRQAQTAKAILGDSDNDWTKMTGYQKAKTLEQGALQGLAGLIHAQMPQTWGEFAGDIASLGAMYAFHTPEGAGLISSIGRLAGRLGVPPLIAAGTAYATGEDPLAAGLQTAGQTTIGEAGGKTLDLLGARSPEKVQESDVQRLGTWIQKHIPSYKGPLKSNADIYDAFRASNPNNAVAAAGKDLKAVESTILRSPLGNQQLSLPALSHALLEAGLDDLVSPNDSYGFGTALGLLKKLNNGAYNFRGDPATKTGTKYIRGLIHDAGDEVGAQLNALDPNGEAGTFWRLLRYQASGAMTLNRLLQEKDVRLGHMINIPALQNLILSGGDVGYDTDLTRTFGPTATQKLQTSILRGGRPGAGMDIPEGKSLWSSLRVYFHHIEPPSVGVHPPNLESRGPRYAGKWRRWPRVPPLAKGAGAILSGPVVRQEADEISADRNPNRLGY